MLKRRQRNKAEPARLKVSEQAAAIIGERDAEIAALRENVAVRLQEVAERDAAIADLRASVARMKEAVEASRVITEGLHERRALLIAECAAEHDRADRAERELARVAAALVPLAAVKGMTIADRATAAATLLDSLELPGEAGDALARAALEDASPDPQSPAQREAIDRMLTARSKTRRRS